ncbi:15-hydroxyprostaglandin dehydrogenase [NAD(+)]-like [Mizuhopecten yessoensis]|uniref:15-hydroxyprostaglandin dehydrogenase [NAD(+)] n=1 Tax=Mizuhopecten yessoensis TaxID=6573 RepID=A0A210QH72_MIZYE|nr:15-hydroxyprostaglandin dehydrogenase [NAD(+)]-like [Mizuhopecten yessoensis]OWF48049.1 15-hydroxyprostaglandin dehydrogenase [NAD(+)] [Mizuhopecten yessoensis]
MQIEGKVALVTGGAQGLGYAFVQALLDKGAKICFCDINTNQGEATLKQLSDKYGAGNVMFRRCDVTSQKDMEELFKATKDRYGRIDIVCNNAGMGGETYPQWEQVVDVNIKGMTRGSFIAFEYLRNDKGGNGGVIVNISSAAGLSVNPMSPVYCATKTAIIALTRCLASNEEVRNCGIRVNTLCPSFADTDLVKQISPFTLHDDAETKMENSAKVTNFLSAHGLMTTDTVAESFMELVMDETKNGAVLRVSKGKGNEYCKIEVSV